MHCKYKGAWSQWKCLHTCTYVHVYFLLCVVKLFLYVPEIKTPVTIDGYTCNNNCLWWVIAEPLYVSLFFILSLCAISLCGAPILTKLNNRINTGISVCVYNKYIVQSRWLHCSQLYLRILRAVNFPGKSSRYH